LLVYVDIIIVIGNDEHEQQRLSQCLAREFEIKTLEKLRYFLRIEVVTLGKGFLYLNKSLLLICYKK